MYAILFALPLIAAQPQPTDPVATVVVIQPETQFAQIDTDQDGLIDREELDDSEAFDVSVFTDVFERMDGDSDGWINFNEFAFFLNENPPPAVVEEMEDSDQIEGGY